EVLLENGVNIETTLLEKAENLNVFPRQIAEEKEKIKLYKNQPELYDYFLEYERHPYFHGQIEFIINLSKDINNSKIDTSILKNYGDKLSKLFQPDTIDDNNFLFARGLLTEVNYFQSKSQNRWQFFSNNNAL